MADEENSALEDPRQFIRCRYCGQRNQIRPGENIEARCGRCRLILSEEPHKKFASLNKDQYIHPADRKALAALRAIPGIDTALKKLLEVTGESAIRVIFTASAVKVTPKQCPDLYAKLQIACATLGVEPPELFVQQSPIPNAFTGGVKRPVIVLYSALLERLTDEEVLAMLIKEILSLTMRYALLAWSRRAELSCDRAALLVTQDAHVVGRTMMKLAGGTFASRVDYEQFLEQGRDFQKNYDEKALDRFWADIITASMSHPFPIWRVSEVLKWVESGEYKALINVPESAAA